MLRRRCAASLWSGNPKIHFTRTRHMSNGILYLRNIKRRKSASPYENKNNNHIYAGKCKSLFFISALEAIKRITRVWFVFCLVNPLHAATLLIARTHSWRLDTRDVRVLMDFLVFLSFITLTQNYMGNPTTNSLYMWIT